ncbi:MAG: excinuclease ABC subunit UvrC [Holosporales bacterium]|jgi:excinuclease ABC subunit C|nr:excinuclease ABC subunit UvrC [Holosporales bacterium]
MIDTAPTDIIKSTAQEAGNYPGVYKMYDRSSDAIMYVGKAKNLKNRLLSYTRNKNLPNRLKMMISQIGKIEYTITHSEIEALILESNLIKELKPYFNIILRDDKSYPYIVVDEPSSSSLIMKEVLYPRIFKVRSHKSKGDNFYGPYPFVSALNLVLKVIQKAFLIRNCTDNFFKQRKRPCLQYFIKRCSAPCVNNIGLDEYKKNVLLAKKLLEGNDEDARKMLLLEMREASQKEDFEKAASIRDRITAISEIQSKQYATLETNLSIDVIAMASTVTSVSFFRNGKNVGSETFLTENNGDIDSMSRIEEFITQFYKIIRPPAIIITSEKLENKEILSKFLNRKIIDNPTGSYKKIIEISIQNVKLKQNNEKFDLKPLEILTKIKKINRIEIYDNSHIMGTGACGAMVVFEDGALRPKYYRKFSISSQEARGGDDIAMMKYVLNKRLSSKHISQQPMPELIIIDGGYTQLAAANEIIKGITNVIAITKQDNRKMGAEKIILEEGTEIFLGENNSTLNFLIMLRNEAHKTAITFHRKKMKLSMHKSALDIIPTIGPLRKKRLLEHFGSISAIKNATIDDIISVQGIDKKSAKIVFDFFNKRT